MATASPSIREDIIKSLHLINPLIPSTSFDQPNLYLGCQSQVWWHYPRPQTISSKKGLAMLILVVTCEELFCMRSVQRLLNAVAFKPDGQDPVVTYVSWHQFLFHLFFLFIPSNFKFQDSHNLVKSVYTVWGNFVSFLNFY